MRDGAELDAPGRLHLLHAGGHTPGSSILVAGAARIVFTGDELATVNMITGEPGPQLLPDSYNRDPAAARRSRSRLEEIDAEWLAPGHGAPHRQSDPATGVVSAPGATPSGERCSV